MGQMLDMDEIFGEIGEFGSLQKFYLILLASSHFYAPFELVQTVFTGEAPIFRCVTNGIEMKNACPNNSIKHCDSIEYEIYPNTFAREWGLICDEAYKVNLVQSILMTGVLAGAVVFGPMADTFGRRGTLMTTTIGSCVSGILSSFMPSFLLYTCARFMVGFFTAGNMTCSFVLATELIGSTKRGLTGNVIPAACSVGIVVFSAIGFFVPQWRIFSLACSSVGGVLLINFMCVHIIGNCVFRNNEYKGKLRTLFLFFFGYSELINIL